MKNSYFTITTLFLLLFNTTAQEDQVLNRIKQGNRLCYKEAIVLHTDRQAFVSGETMYFKVYCIDPVSGIASGFSKVAYIELLDEHNQPVARTKTIIYDGTGNGYLKLPGKTVSGSYILRAYTRYMTNYSVKDFFHTPIHIINPFSKSLYFRDTSKTITNDSYNIEFYPEFSFIFEEIPNKIYFKVYDDIGKLLDINGFVADKNGNKVSIVENKKPGIGNFLFTPEPGEEYDFLLMLPDSTFIAYDLPEIKSKGYLISVDSLNILSLQKYKSNTSKAETFNLMIFKNGYCYYENSILLTNIYSLDLNTLIQHDGIYDILVLDNLNKIKHFRSIYLDKRTPGTFSIKTNKSVYEKRERVKVEINPVKHDQHSKLSLSVHLSPPFQNPVEPENMIKYMPVSERLNAIDWKLIRQAKNTADINNVLATIQYKPKAYADYASSLKRDIVNPPEFNGITISGKLINKNTGQPVPGKVLSLSFYGETAFYHETTSNDTGYFSFSIYNQHGQKDAVVMAKHDSGQYLVQLDEEYFTGYDFSKEYTMEQSAQNITYLTRLLNNYNVRDDFFQKYHYEPEINDRNFYDGFSYQIDLDDFIELPVMEEVFIEILKETIISRKKKEWNLEIINSFLNRPIGSKPLILLDGVLFTNLNDLMLISPEDIKYVELVNYKYFLGESELDGIIHFKTRKKDFAKIDLATSALFQTFQATQPEGVFIPPTYEDGNKNQNTPDYRSTLLWVPELELSDNLSDITFYTPDVPGMYEITLKGFLENGTMINETFNFEVR